MLRRGLLLTLVILAAILALVGAGLVADEGSGSKAPVRKDLAGDPLPQGALARMGTLHWRHGAAITFVAFLPDGKSVVTAGEDKTIRLWDRETGKEIRRFTRPAKEGSGSEDPRDPKDVRQMMVPWGVGGNQVSVALSPDGKTLAGVVEGTSIQLWEVATGKALREIKWPAAGIGALVFSADSKLIAARGGNQVTYVWEAETAKEVNQIKAKFNQPGGGVVILGVGGFGGSATLAMSPDNKNLAWAETEFDGKGQFDAFVKIVDRESGKEVRRLKVDPNGGSSGVAYSPDGKTLAYASGNAIHLCAADSDKELRQLKGHTAGISMIAFAPDGKSMFSRSKFDGTLRLWDIEKGEELRKLGAAEPPPGGGVGVFFIGGYGAPAGQEAAFAPDGKSVAVAVGNAIRFFSTETGKEVARQDGHRAPVTSVVISTDGKTIISKSGDGTVRRWEASTGKELSSFQVPAGTTCVALAPDGKSVALGNQDNTVRVHDSASGKELHKLTGPAGGVAVVAFTKDSKTIAARGAGNSNIALYEAGTGNEVKTITVEADAPPGPGGVVVVPGWGIAGSGPVLAFSPDGKTLASLVAGNNAFIRGPGAGGGNGPAIELFDVATGKSRKIALPQDRQVANLVFAPDGRTLASENADRTITIYEVAGGKERIDIGKPDKTKVGGGAMGVMVVGGGFGLGGAGAVSPTITFAPDGRKLAARVGSEIQIWEVSTGKVIKKFEGHQGDIVSLAFAPDGKSLATGSSDTTILLWDTSDLPAEKSRFVELTAKELEQHWTELAGGDAAKAYLGIETLTAAPKQAIGFLKDQLKPVVPVEQKVLDQYIADLDSDNFDARKTASEELEKLGELSVPALNKVLGNKPSLEMRKRVEELLDKVVGGFISGERLRIVRAVEVLERLNTPESRQLLETLAKGAPGALPTREAQAALERLGK